MYIQSEKDLEEYIIKNNKRFKQTLKEIYNVDEEIKFLGNQVRLGDIICDMLYYFDKKEKIDPETFVNTKCFIVIENKFRKAEPKDIAQISKYMSVIEDKIIKEYPEIYAKVYGVIVALGSNSAMQDILLNDSLNNIKIVGVNTYINFEEENWNFKDEYIENVKLDDRLIKVLMEK